MMCDPFTRLFKNVCGKKEVQILMVGLDGAGKTTLLYKLKNDELVITNPTIGFNIENVEYNDISFKFWDVCGQDKIRPFWKYYFKNTHGLVLVIDSNDRERLNEAKDELMKLLADDNLKAIPLLMFAHKQDLPNSMNTSEIAENIGLYSLHKKNWHLQPTYCSNHCSKKLESNGLHEGLEWLKAQQKL